MGELVHASARLVDAASGEKIAGAHLAAAVADAALAYDVMPDGIVFALMATEIAPIIRFLGAFAAGRPVALLDPQVPPATLRDLIDRFTPAVVISTDQPPPAGYRGATDERLGRHWRRIADAVTQPHPDLALLLTTSGSTGNPKLVRLARSAVLANAEAITVALGIDGDEVAPTTLPLHYTFGLSVLTSHLMAGATVLLDRAGLAARDFWTAIDTFGATSIAAVPYQYEILRRLRFTPDRFTRLRTLTQAGGRLGVDLIAEFHLRMAAAGGRLFVMYGQTEATARMTVLPAGRLPEKLGSVGLPVPGGSVRIGAGPEGSHVQDGLTGEIFYRGPNVMMGYAERAADLALGDELGGVLATGDLGHLDGDGFLYVTGRLKRIAKVFGVRVNLDDVERQLSHHGPLAAIAGDDRLVVVAEGVGADQLDKIHTELAERLGTHSSGVVVRSIEALPRTAAGKIDYRALESS